MKRHLICVLRKKVSSGGGVSLALVVVASVHALLHFHFHCGVSAGAPSSPKALLALRTD